MITKRMTASLRRQDWTMVSIEFVLVVVGVLLGFQINEWSNQRINAQERREATGRLLEESENDVAYLRQAVDFEARIGADLRFALARLSDGNWRRSDESRMAAGLGNARSMVALSPESSVYNDIVASGDLNKIGDVALRSAISRYQSTLSFEERMRTQLQVPLASYERNPAFRYHVDSEGKNRVGLSVNFASLKDDLAGLQTIALTAENHRILLMLRNRALKDGQRMCIALGKSLGRDCNLRLSAPTFG